MFKASRDQSHASPLDQLDPEHQFDEWEYILYIMTLSFLIEGERPALAMANDQRATRSQRCFESQTDRWPRS